MVAVIGGDYYAQNIATEFTETEDDTILNSTEIDNSTSMIMSPLVDVQEIDWKAEILPELYFDNGTKKYDDEMRFVPTLKVYAQNIPSYSHDSITMKTVDDALKSWEGLNPDLKFEMVDKLYKSDIAIKWVTRISPDFLFGHFMGVTESETRIYEDGTEETRHAILIDLADLDCNGNPLYWSNETITDTIKHEFGHALGILDHSSDENHLMYDPDTGIDVIDDLGYDIPEKGTKEYYVGTENSWDRYNELDTRFVSTLADFGYTVEDWNNDTIYPSHAVIPKINTIIDEMNLELDKNNCFTEPTNLYDPYGN